MRSSLLKFLQVVDLSPLLKSTGIVGLISSLPVNSVLGCGVAMRTIENQRFTVKEVFGSIGDVG